jgi:hypothetical protein
MFGSEKVRQLEHALNAAQSTGADKDCVGIPRLSLPN